MSKEYNSLIESLRSDIDSLQFSLQTTRDRLSDAERAYCRLQDEVRDLRRYIVRIDEVVTRPSDGRFI